MIVSNFPSLPTFLGKKQKTDYFQMLPSLPTFLGRRLLKSIDGKLWLGRLPSLPILKAKVHQYCQQSLADITSCRQIPRKPRQNLPIFVGFEIILFQGPANNAKKLAKNFLQGRYWTRYWPSKTTDHTCNYSHPENV